MTAFAYLLNKQLVMFDPEYGLAQHTPKSLLTALAQDNLLAEALNENGNMIVHFQSPNCQCDQVSSGHIMALNNQAAHHFSIKQITVSANHSAIPSTPAVAIVESGELLYFGPYGQGIGCNNSQGFAQTVLNNLNKGFRANIIVSDAKGCYCQPS
ncbi:DUF6436 domain-containing protein [Colwellia sp. MEBiC06753]